MSSELFELDICTLKQKEKYIKLYMSEKKNRTKSYFLIASAHISQIPSSFTESTCFQHLSHLGLDVAFSLNDHSEPSSAVTEDTPNINVISSSVN